MRWRRHAVLALLVPMLVGTILVPGASAARHHHRHRPTPRHARVPRTAWDKLLAAVPASGRVSKRTALEAFALAYRPLPGVTVPSGGKSDLNSLTDVDQWILGHLRQLTPGQRRVVARVLGVPTPTHAARAAGLIDLTFTPTPWVQAIVDHWISVFSDSAHLNIPMTLDVVAGITDLKVTDEKGNPANADTVVFNSEGEWGSGTPAKCRIRLTPEGLAKSDARINAILAHETFHCFQLEILGDKAWQPFHLWIMEGTAKWVDLSVAAPYPNDQVWPGEYVANPQTPLFKRSYDAEGFWGHVQDEYGDLWSRFTAIITNETDDEAAYAAAGGYLPQFLNSWASSTAEQPAGGPPWEMVSPITPEGSAEETKINVDGSGSAAPYTTALFRFRGEPGTPLVRVSVDGYGRLSVEHNYTDLHDKWFCIDPAGCECPPNTSGVIPQNEPLENPSLLGLTGDPARGGGTTAAIESVSLDEFCKPTQPSPPYHPGNAGSGGDPHLNTFDGAYYDFQAAGEFTLMKSTRDDLQVQVRQRPANFEGEHIAFITAVAVRDGGATIEVDGNGTEYLDKHRATFSTTPRRLPGGGTVEGLYGVTVRWRDGTAVEIFPGTAIGMAVTAHAARDRRHHLEGLWGPYSGGHPARDFIGRNGVRYRASAGYGGPAFGALYGQFGNSWRITQKQSLFVYPRGKSTRSYTRLRYPPNPVGLGHLSPAALAKARAACLAAGIKVAGVLRDCELDIGLTGNDGYAAGDAHLQAAALGTPVPPAGALRSRVPWAQLSSQPNQTVQGEPSIGITGGGQAVVAYRTGAQAAIEAATFTPGAAGVSGISRTPLFAGWQSTNAPLVLGGPGGTLQVLMAGVHSANTDPLNGTVIEPRSAAGTFGSPTPLSATVGCCVTSAITAADGSTPLWAATPAYNLLVFDGTTQNDLTSAAPGKTVEIEAPTLGRDSSGRAWVAWYVFSETRNVSGLYMMRINPETGAAAGPAMAVPDSDGGPEFNATIALACAQICRVVYVPFSNSEALVSWAPGQRAPTKVFSGLIGDHPQLPGDVRAVYGSDGRLWVTWFDAESRLEYAILGDSTGAGGQPIALPPVRGYYDLSANDAAAVGTRLVLAGEWYDGQTLASAEFATVVNPPQ